MNSQEAFIKQKEILDYYRANQPALLLTPQKRSEQETFTEIGIYNMPVNRPVGYLRLFPQDFIVEEKTQNNKYIRINEFLDQQNISGSPDEKNRTLYANLIKIGIPTNIALEKTAAVIGFPASKMGYAGLKDADAITAQLIALPNLNIPIEEIINKKIPNVFLTNFYYGQGTLNPGDLQENIFTITVRTKEVLEEAKLREQLETLKTKGFLNYYQSQRFGGLRLMSHQLGKLILRQEYQKAITEFLFRTSEYDIPLVVNLRQEAERAYPNWSAVSKVYEKLPYTFFNELRALEYLIKEPTNYIGALFHINDQTQLWIYAYVSLLFNKYISYLESIDFKTDRQFPLLLSDKSEDREIYAQVLKEDGIINLQESLRPFKFIQLKRRLVAGRSFPKEIEFKIFGKCLVITFALGKGAYATTFLANLFELFLGLPIPKWVELNEIDPKEILGLGNIKKVKEIFKDEFYSKQEFDKAG